MARIPKLDAAGKFLAADVNAQIDARAKAATAPLLDGKRGVEATELGTEHLDTVTTPGTYTQSANLEATLDAGYPVTRGGVLQVERSVSKTMVWQTYTTYAPSPSTPAQTWQRGSYNGTWTPWARVGGGVDGSVPIFPTLAEATAWEAANPGKKALTLEASTPDTTAPTWPVGAAIAVAKTDTAATLTLTQLPTDDRGVSSYEVSLDSGATWKTVALDAATRALKVTGLSRSTAYPAPRVRVKDAAGNTSAVLTASAGFTTDAAPPVPYQQTALALNPLHFYVGTGNTNLGTYGAHTASTHNSGTPNGATLAGFPTSYSMSGGQRMQVQTSEGLAGQSAWSFACVFRFKSFATGGVANDDLILLTFEPLDYRNALRLVKSSTDATAPFTFAFGGKALPQSPLADPYTGEVVMLVGVDFDSTVSDQATFYVNGKAHATATSAPTPAANKFVGPTSGSTYGRITSSVDWAGLVMTNKALGAAAHMQLAKDAGVYAA